MYQKIFFSISIYFHYFIITCECRPQITTKSQDALEMKVKQRFLIGSCSVLVGSCLVLVGSCLVLVGSARFWWVHVLVTAITVVAVARLLCSRFVRDIILCDVVCTLAKYRYSSNMGESSSEFDDVELESNYSSSENDEYFEKEINAMNILENENFWRIGLRLKSARKSSLVLLFWMWDFLTMRVHECKCCCECKSLLGDKLKGVKYITSNSEFHILCLNKIFLETAFTATKINTAR